MIETERRSLLQTIFGRLRPGRVLTQLRMLLGYSPVFTPWTGMPYQADVVRAAVDAVARNAAKLRAKHIRRVDGRVIPVGGHIERLLTVRPNPNMNAYDFLYRLVTTLLIDNNAFAYPVWDGPHLTAIWPINCLMAEFLEDESRTLFVKFYFADGHVVLPYSEVLHLRRHYYSNDLLGEQNDAINATLSAIHTTNEGLAQAVKTSAHLRGILKFQGLLKDEDIQKNRDRFVQQYMTLQNSGGVAALDGKAEYQELKNQPLMVQADQMKELRDSVFRYFGVSEAIVKGDYTEDQWNAFYESTIEPLAVQMSLEFTSKLFTPRELGHGNEIIFEANRLQYASMTTKLNLREMVDRGALTPNEWREALNLAPVEGGDKPIRRLDTRPTDEDNNEKGGDTGGNGTEGGVGQEGDPPGRDQGTELDEGRT
ncbi:phage portal protein [Symbiobacterium terraclitae]|uniref:phage portal protein n=1 Tax=Symbiobacterium terraclitae TaxID=557451 RepID=UPI0035B50DAE